MMTAGRQVLPTPEGQVKAQTCEVTWETKGKNVGREEGTEVSPKARPEGVGCRSSCQETPSSIISIQLEFPIPAKSPMTAGQRRWREKQLTCKGPLDP